MEEDRETKEERIRRLADTYRHQRDFSEVSGGVLSIKKCTKEY